jgi:predicted MFS family arabinose efflux permease
VASAVTVVCSLPTFLTGAMAVEVAHDLGFGTVGIGGAVATFFGTMALASIHLGRLVDRLGATVSLRIAVVAAALAALGNATANTRWLTLAGWLVLSGLAAALAQPAANRLLVNRIRADRLGTAFGLKQSAPPLASMLAGLSVPAIALTVGWRWAFGLTALAAALIGLAVRALPRPATPPVSGPRLARKKLAPLRDRPTLAILAFGFGLAFVASSAVLAFYVDAAVFAGTSHRDAGLVFAFGSLLAIAIRVAAGIAADRLEFSPLRFSAILLAVGSVGLVLLGTARPAVMGAGAIVALAGTWGFPGLFWFALVSAFPDTPGRVTGAMAPAAIGGVVGPVGFGVLASAAGYPFAWRLAGLLAMLAVGALLYGAHRLAATVGAQPAA